MTYAFHSHMLATEELPCFPEDECELLRRRDGGSRGPASIFRLIFLKEAILNLTFHLFIYYMQEPGFLSWLLNKTAVYYTSVYKKILADCAIKD